ncbi:hypothetical protein SAMN06297422_13814 [Lachnospiraceae bacterium]|jgi:hypothetical protein|nr:hypothetical protein SAMN06297422_13814 [Lachnospiraceae bacterium]
MYTRGQFAVMGNVGRKTLLNTIVISVGIRPLIKRKGSQYQGVIDKWKIRGISI